MDYDVYMHDLVVLVIIFGASPRSLKTESGWKTCCVLGVGKLLSLPFQPRWFHLVWSFLAKVIAFQDLLLCVAFPVRSLRPPWFWSKVPRGRCLRHSVRSWSGVSPESPPSRSLRYEFFCIGFFPDFLRPESPPLWSGVSARAGVSGLPDRKLWTKWLQRLFF